MKICKYCKKPISDEQVWNPDEEGNGYHNACLCEMEFISRDRQIYNKGRSDILDKIRAEIECLHNHPRLDFIKNDEIVDMILEIIDKYREEQ